MKTLMQRIIAAFGLIALTIGAPAPACALTPEDLVGTWKMLSTVRQLEGDDKVINNLGEHPKGIMIITPDYRFIIIETGDGRKAASTTEEFAALQKSELAYSGLVTFSPDPIIPKA
jgi:Lipocalin-like domain